MKIRKLIYLFLCVAISFSALNSFEIQAKKANSKATTTQANNSKKGTNSKNSKNDSKNTKTNSKNDSKNSKNSKNDSKNNSKSNQSSNASKNNNAPAARASKSSKKKGTTAVKSSIKEEPKEVAQNDSLTLAVNSRMLEKIPSHLNPGGLRVNSVKLDQSQKTARIGLNENFTYMPVSRQLIDTLTLLARKSLPDSISNYRVTLNVGKNSLSYFIHKVDPLPEKNRHNPDFVKEVYPMVKAPKGMDNDILAMWHSHGRYYKNGGWAWQRPFLFETAEDVYTMSYMLPYIVPMLENAGAYVLLPRERDPNPNEVIVDNDTNEDGELYSQTTYKEMSGVNKWHEGELEGFIYDLKNFRDTENPFENGTYRQVKTQKGGTPSIAAWCAEIPEDGEYAVYVSYKSLPNSTTDAHYTVNYSGGSKEFTVNQQMGGGTWIYLGTFPFEQGYDDILPVVSLSNITKGKEGTIVTADAIKIGGGMGNIERSPNRKDIYYDPSTPDKTIPNETAQNDSIDEADDEDIDQDQNDGDDEDIDNPENTQKSETSPAQTTAKKGPAPRFTTSGMPRFVEGARYWLHWAGFPEYIYSPYHGKDDYKDDYTSRGHWVNYLAGGSRVLPKNEGLKIPVDAAFALHSDAGKRDNDSFVGTLGIYYTQNGGTYKDGTPRINSRMLTDMIMQQVTNDIRREYEPNWTRRSMWDKSYLEARVPEVPTTLLEFMSHQNFADMMYGLDPSFRFTVGRAIYKGIARFMAERKSRKLVIQPLPVQQFMIKRTKTNMYRLSWKPTPDKLEPTAVPDRYIIMERSGDDLGFHKIGETKSTHFDVKVTDNDIHSFYVIAANDGGNSFPSETLALREAKGNTKPVLIVNGFTRVAAPGHTASSGSAGFNSEDDFGVPYIRDISFTGHQTEFRRSGNHGLSGQSYITKVIAGNTFDFAAVHGRSFMAQGLGFVSASIGAVEAGDVKLSDYETVDLILGKQKKTTIGKGSSGIKFRAFTETMQKELRNYVEKGGHLIISGQYAVSDLTDSKSTEADRKFAAEVLGATGADSNTSKPGKVVDARTGKQIKYSATLNEKNYIVEKPDIINSNPSSQTEKMLSFENGSLAGQYVKYGRGNVAILTIPLEAMTDANERTTLIKQILTKLGQK